MLDLSEFLAEVEDVPDKDFLSDVSMPSGTLSDLSFSFEDDNCASSGSASVEKKKAEPRCDMQHRLRMTRRSDVNFISVWQRTPLGRTLTELKDDDSMVPVFAKAIVPTINDSVGRFLQSGDWCVCTSPKRRHTERNFATRVAEQIASSLSIPFYEDVALCKNKHRMGAVFELNVLPKECNIIVYDDIVTSGQTLKGMKTLLEKHDKNLVFFTNINNKID